MSDYIVKGTTLVNLTRSSSILEYLEEIPEGTTTIGKECFANSSVREIDIPAGVTRIEDYAFSDCFNLTTVRIPDGVTMLGKRIFDGCQKLKEIVLPEGVSCIGDGLFYGCTKLTSVHIPKTVKMIAPTAFSGCAALNCVEVAEGGDFVKKDGIVFTKDFEELVLCERGKTGETVIPAGVKRIWPNAFENCKKITRVELPDSVAEIGGSAFVNCTRLSSFRLPVGIRKLPDNIFRNCESLTDAALPQSIISIGNAAFKACPRLEGITLPNINVIPDEAFWGCSNLRKVVIPEEATEIGWRAFGNCSNLESISIPSSIKMIGAQALSGCEKLCEIDNQSDVLVWDKNILGSTIPVIHENTFDQSTFEKMHDSYKELAVVFHLQHTDKFAEAMANVCRTYIKKHGVSVVKLCIAKQDEALLHSLLKTGLLSLAAVEKGITAAKKQPNLVTMLLDYQNSHFDKDAEQKKKDKAIEKKLTASMTPTAELKKLWGTRKLADGTLEISSYKGEDTRIEVPGQIGKGIVTAISGGAFSCRAFGNLSVRELKMQELEEVVLPNSIVEIGWGAFEGCKGLKKIHFPEGLVKIETNAFMRCENLTEVILPQSLRTVGYGAFRECRNLQKIKVLGVNTTIDRDIVAALAYKPQTVICAPAGSYAEEYAKENNIPFEAI